MSGTPEPSPEVTLVMPVWSPERAWLREAVASALGQEACELELVLVDDGCNPPVADLLDGLEDRRMRILRMPHGGASRARNAGLAHARGQFVRFVDADDVLVRDSTAHLLGIARSCDRVIAYGATAVCSADLRQLATITTAVQGHVAVACLLNRFATTIHSLLFPRSLLEEVGQWEPSLVVSEDWDYALRAFEKAEVRGDGRIATLYRTHERMSSKNVLEGIRGYRLVVERYFQRHPDERGGRLERRALAGYHVFAAVQYATRLRDRRKALGHLARAFARDPLATAGSLARATAAAAAGAATGLLRRARGESG